VTPFSQESKDETGNGNGKKLNVVDDDDNDNDYDDDDVVAATTVVEHCGLITEPLSYSRKQRNSFSTHN
jgi:hypothetical protein